MRLTILSIVYLLSTASVAGATVDYSAGTGALPSQICPAWSRFNGGTTDGTVIGGKLVLKSTTGTMNLGYIQTAPAVEFGDATRAIEFRVRYVSGSTAMTNRAPIAIIFTTAPGVGGSFFVGRDQVFLSNPANAVAFVDTDANFHTYRLEFDPTHAIRVYYDGALLLTGSTLANATEFGNTPRIAFGELSSYTFGTSEWEFFRHDAAADNATRCLVSWWCAEGDARDSAGTHHGTLAGDTRFDSGVCDGSAFSFDGSSDGVSVPDAADLGNMSTFSFDAWVSFDTIPAGRLQFAMAKGPVAATGTTSYALWLNESASISAAVETTTQRNTAIATKRLSSGRRHHVAVTYDAAQIRLYIDGELVATAPLTGVVRDTTSALYLGRREGGTSGGDSIDGTVDEARIWRRVLSATEIAAAAGVCSNEPPVAVAGDDQTVECSGGSTTVSLDGGASSDPNGDELTYEWLVGSTVIGTGNTTEVALTSGEHTVTLRVTDTSGLASEDTVTVVVADTTAPVVSAPPAVEVTLHDDASSCSVHVSDAVLGTPSASDGCSGDVEVTRSGVPSGNLFPVGTTTVTYTARDAAGNESTAEQIVTVTDTSAPSIGDVTASTTRLWPGDHKMVDVFLRYAATEVCGDATVSLSVQSSDSADAKGDVTSPDWVIINEHHVQLRAERAPTSAERVYTITVDARDSAGNTSSRRVEVVVAPPNGSR